MRHLMGDEEHVPLAAVHAEGPQDAEGPQKFEAIDPLQYSSGQVVCEPDGTSCCCCDAPPQCVSAFVRENPVQALEYSQGKTAYGIIANPFSGNGLGGRHLQLVTEYLDRHALSYKVLQTQYAKHATVLAHDTCFGENFDALLVIGGDGTIHECVTGILRRVAGQAALPAADIEHIPAEFREHVQAAGGAQGGDDQEEASQEQCIPVGLIAGGTGNSVVWSIYGENCMDMEYVMDSITSREIRMMDVGRVRALDLQAREECEWFMVNLLGWGLVADANETAEECRCLGKLRYDVAGLWELCKAKERQVKLVMDDDVPLEGEINLILVQNCVYGGSQMKFAPYSKMDDGFFDVVLSDKPGRCVGINLFNELKRGGSHIWLDGVQYFRCRDLSIEDLSDPHSIINIDGENCARMPLQLSMIPQCIKILCDGSVSS